MMCKVRVAAVAVAFHAVTLKAPHMLVQQQRKHTHTHTQKQLRVHTHTATNNNMYQQCSILCSNSNNPVLLLNRTSPSFMLHPHRSSSSVSLKTKNLMQPRVFSHPPLAALQQPHPQAAQSLLPPAHTHRQWAHPESSGAPLGGRVHQTATR